MLFRSSTQLNVAGPALAALEGVHAMTDVTGFGLAGHALEMARGAGLCAHLKMAQVPLLSQVREWVSKGVMTGASARNWAAYGHEVEMASTCNAIDQALLSDPQTSGGLLVACAPAALAQVLGTLHELGFEQASEIGSMQPRHSQGLALRVD